MADEVTGTLHVVPSEPKKDVPTLTQIPAPGVRYPVLDKDQIMDLKPAEFTVLNPEDPTFPRDIGGEIELVLQQTGPYNPNLTTHYHYDHQGRLVDKRRHLTDKGCSNRDVYVYDDHGRLVEERWYSRNPELVEPKEPVLQITKTYEYDPNKPDYLYKKTQIVHPQN